MIELRDVRVQRGIQFEIWWFVLVYCEFSLFGFKKKTTSPPHQQCFLCLPKHQPCNFQICEEREPSRSQNAFACSQYQYTETKTFCLKPTKESEFWSLLKLGLVRPKKMKSLGLFHCGWMPLKFQVWFQNSVAGLLFEEDMIHRFIFQREYVQL